MTRTHHLLLPLLATVLITGCATRPPPPTDEIAVARSAIGYAEEAGARDHAPAELQMARDKLQRAERALEAREHERALYFAEAAEIDARYADLRSRSARTRLSVDELQASIDALRQELDREARQNQGGQ